MTAIWVLMGIAMLVMALGATAIIAQVRYNEKYKNAADRIAPKLGWRPVFVLPSGLKVWYGGVEQGRRTAIRTFTRVERGTSIDGHASISARLVCRVAMEVVVPNALGVDVAVSRHRRVRADPFLQFFAGEGADRVPAPVREAMLAFTKKGAEEPTKGFRLIAAPRFRHLRLADRAGVNGHNLGTGFLADARAVLIHDHPHPEPEPETLRQIFFDMATVAYAVEQAVLAGTRRG